MVYTVDPTGPNGATPPAASARLTTGLARVAVIGSGVAGLGAAWRLTRAPNAPGATCAVTLFEAGAQLGGHANTVNVTLPDGLGRDVTHGVDTGFLVYNARTYPQLINLFKQLGVATAASDMSFSVQAPPLAPLLRSASKRRQAGRLEWSGSNLSSVFAQRRNLLSWPFVSMLRQVLRFNRLATELAARGDDAAMREPLADFLSRHRFDDHFAQGYLLPMIACIWSCPVDQMLQFPVGTLIRFCDNHGLLQVNRRPRWFTVQGGSRHYVNAIAKTLHDIRLNTPVYRVERDTKGVTVHTSLHGQARQERFDALVFACHAPQALALLGTQASVTEQRVLGAMRTQANRAVLHLDSSVMPQARRAWAAWNYERSDAVAANTSPVCLHYWINQLQPLPFASDVFVSLNPVREPHASTVLGRFDYAHPVFDGPAIAAQRDLPQLQGQQRSWFAGAWCGYGFHEDGLKAGCAAADGIAQALLSNTAHDSSRLLQPTVTAEPA
jgi:uncharacterized protein